MTDTTLNRYKTDLLLKSAWQNKHDRHNPQQVQRLTRGGGESGEGGSSADQILRGGARGLGCSDGAACWCYPCCCWWCGCTAGTARCLRATLVWFGGEEIRVKLVVSHEPYLVCFILSSFPLLIFFSNLSGHFLFCFCFCLFSCLYSQLYSHKIMEQCKLSECSQKTPNNKQF